MNRFSFSILLVPLLLLMLMPAAPDIMANSMVDSAARTWRTTSVELNGSKQVRIDITDAAGPVITFYATSSPGNSIDAFLYAFNDQVWMVWSRERSTLPGTYDIYQRRLFVNGDLDPRLQVTRITGDDDYSDHRATAAACPMGHHVAFQRETTTESGVHRVITYMNNIWNDGSTSDLWTDATPETRELIAGRSGTDVTLLLGNNNDGSPTVMVFKEWVTQYHISGLKNRQAIISIYERIMDTAGPADPNPWEKIKAHLPDNPEQD